MNSKRKIHIESEETSSEREKEVAEVVPEAAMQESADMADTVAESDAEQVLPEDILALQKRCEMAERQAAEEHDHFLRTLADLNNIRRRGREDLEKSRKYAIEDFVLHLLPVLDNFERALKTSEEMQSFEALHGGVVLTFRQLADALEKEGVKPIATDGEQFDPNLHEAVMREETDECPDNTIVEEFQKGYTLGDKVIRPSMVKVACNS